MSAPAAHGHRTLSLRHSQEHNSSGQAKDKDVQTAGGCSTVSFQT